MSRFLDKRLSSLKAYIPGEQPKLGEFIKLNTNEFPYSPANDVAESAKNAVGNMNLYCDLTCKALKERFKDVFGYGGKNVIFTNGSDDALYLCFLTFCGEDCGAAFADITYGFYKVYCHLYKIPYRLVPLNTDMALIVDDYIAPCSGIVIANPNAPTGRAIGINDIRRLLTLHQNRVVIVD